MTVGNEDGTLITLDFSDTEKRFANINELREFMKSQQSAWSWLEKVALQDGNLDRVWDIFKEYFMQGDEFIEHYEMNSEVRKLQIGMINGLRKQTETAAKRGFILAETPIACFVLDLKDNRSPRIAGYTLARLNNIIIVVDNHAAREASYWAAQYIQNSIPNSIEAQHKDRGGEGEQQNNEITGLQKQIRLLIKELYEQTIKQASDFESQMAKQTSAFELMLDKEKKKLTYFETSFKEKYALKESVEYWTKKHAQHQTSVRKTAALTAFVACSTLVVFIWAALGFPELEEVLGKIMDVPQTDPKQLADQKPLGIVRHLSILLAISTTGVWLTRLSAKIFISNLHLRMDADERVTMFKTYFALLAEGKGLNDGDRQLILQTLFRPGSTGFIKDDGPTNALEAVTRKTSDKNG